MAATTPALQHAQLGNHLFALGERLGGDAHRRLVHARQTGCLELRFIRDVTVRSATTVAEALELLPQLTELHLHGDGLPAEAAEVLAKALARSAETLRTLHLRLSSLSTDAARVVANLLPLFSGLTSLKIVVNRIDLRGAVFLAYELWALWGLTTLHVRLFSVGTRLSEALPDSLRFMKHMRFLNLSDTDLGPAGARALAEPLSMMPHLHSLVLVNNSLEAAGLQALAEPLRSTSALALLDVSKNGLSPDAGVAALAKVMRSLPGLATLRVAVNDLQTAGAHALAAELPSWTTLREIGLQGNLFGVAGAQALAAPLLSLTNLQKLYIDDPVSRVDWAPMTGGYAVPPEALQGGWIEAFAYVHARPARALAFAMGLHSRLGLQSDVQALHPDVARTLLEAV